MSSARSSRASGRIRVDSGGGLWIADGDVVHCLALDGTVLGKILSDELVTDIFVGGPQRQRLFIAAGSTLTTSTRRRRHPDFLAGS